jgi:hypothetical protein
MIYRPIDLAFSLVAFQSRGCLSVMPMRPKGAIVMTNAAAFPRILLVEVMCSGVSGEVTANCEAAGWCVWYRYMSIWQRKMNPNSERTCSFGAVLNEMKVEHESNIHLRTQES